MTGARIALAVALVVAVAADATAESRKLIVLPLGGDAAPAVRDRLTASVQRLARVIDGELKSGDTTFGDAAIAVGCDPAAPACADSVRDVLGVDDLIYGVASAHDGKLVVTVHRVSRDAPAREVTATLADGDPPERAEPVLLGLFSTIRPGPGGPTGPGPGEPTGGPATGGPTGGGDVVAPMPPQHRPSRDRNFGIAASAGGAVLLLSGLALWASASGLQKDINAAPTDSFEDLEALRALEDRASGRALAGNLCVLGGLALGGFGGWLLWRDHEARRAAVVTPTPIAGGAGVTLTIGALR